MIDARAGRAGGHATLELVHGRGIALGLDFDATISRVSYPSADPVLHGDSLSEVPESNALDAAAEQISSGNVHASFASCPSIS